MNKYLLLLIPLFLWGCSKKYDTVIDSGVTNYQVTNVSSFTDFNYVPGDSSIVASISFNSVSNIQSVFFNLTSPDGNILNSAPVQLYDDGNETLHGDSTAGDKTYSNKYPLSMSDLKGKYTIIYYIENSFGKTALVAEHNFLYNNGIKDAAPIVSNLVAPDTVTLNTTATTFIPISIQASDSNGLNDLEFVFFNSFKPDGTPSSNNPIILFDDGSSVHGDAAAGDGIYSRIISLPDTGVAKGTYRWEFQARDRESNISNIIIHNIVVK
jgi:hypothetical protein